MVIDEEQSPVNAYEWTLPQCTVAEKRHPAATYFRPSLTQDPSLLSTINCKAKMKFRVMCILSHLEAD